MRPSGEAEVTALAHTLGAQILTADAQCATLSPTCALVSVEASRRYRYRRCKSGRPVP